MTQISQATLEKLREQMAEVFNKNPIAEASAKAGDRIAAAFKDKPQCSCPLCQEDEPKR